MKCNQSRPGFELVSPCSFPTTITITPRAPLCICYIVLAQTIVRHPSSRFASPQFSHLVTLYRSFVSPSLFLFIIFCFHLPFFSTWIKNDNETTVSWAHLPLFLLDFFSSFPTAVSWLVGWLVGWLAFMAYHSLWVI